MFLAQVPIVIIDELSTAEVALTRATLGAAPIITVTGTVIVEHKEVRMHVSRLHTRETVFTGVDRIGTVATAIGTDLRLSVTGSARLGVDSSIAPVAGVAHSSAVSLTSPSRITASTGGFDADVGRVTRIVV